MNDAPWTSTQYVSPEHGLPYTIVATMSTACERQKREKENINKKVKDEGAAENESKDGDDGEVHEKFRPSAPPQPQASELVVRTKAAKSKTSILLKYLLR